MRLVAAILLSIFVHFAAAGFLTTSFSPASAPVIAEVSLVAHKSPQKIKSAQVQDAAQSAKSSNDSGNPDQVWPELLSQPTLQYPSSWKSRNLSGVVRAKLKISSLGVVEDVEILESQNEEMSEVAEKAMRGFRFRPAISAGQAIASEIEYSYRFVLR